MMISSINSESSSAGKSFPQDLGIAQIDNCDLSGGQNGVAFYFWVLNIHSQCVNQIPMWIYGTHARKELGESTTFS